MNKFILAALGLAITSVHASTVETKAAAETETKATVAVTQEQPTKNIPVMRDPMLTKTSINRAECLVCTTHGCFAVHADLIDLNKVFVTQATNGQNVLVPYDNKVSPG